MLSHSNGFAVKGQSPKLDPDRNFMELKIFRVFFSVPWLNHKPGIPNNPRITLHGSLNIFVIFHSYVIKPTFYLR
jgi:hypothetical protein